MSRVRLIRALAGARSPRRRRAPHGSRRGACLLVLLLALTGMLAPNAGAAVAYRDHTCALVTNTTSIVLPKPAGTVAGDVLVANVGFASTTASSGPAGWTKLTGIDGTVASSHRLSAWYRVAGASEPASYTFSVTGAADVIGGGVAAFSGVDPDAPVADAALWAGASSDKLFTLPNAAGTAAGSMRVSAVALDDTSSSAYSGGMTELCDQQSSVGADLGQSSAYEATGAGTTATRTVSLDENLNGVLHTLVLRPAPPPSVSSVAPAAGPTAGGTVVTITGAHFTGATSVTFGGTAATGVTVVNATTITATAPARAAGTADVLVTAPSGTSANTAADDFTYVPPPTVTALAPSAGPTGGATSVTITGTNLSGASAVSFGGTPATSFTVDSATQITATAPARAAGTIAVRVTTVGGQSADTAADDYTYVAPPTVTGLVPATGPAAGGTSVVITGTNLSTATAVTFGGAAATFVVDTASQITATAPAGSAGPADVRVTTIGGQSANTGADDYTYVAAPAVTSVSPAAGPTAGGTSVTITGTNLSGASAVSFGGTPATGFTVDSATQITATAPAHAAGTVDVRVTTIGGQSANTAADDYAFAPVPAVTGLAPTEGPLAGGASVTITGTGLAGATAVTFGGIVVAAFSVDSPTQITATTPAGAGAGVVDVRVTTPGGQSANTPADDYLYEDPCGGGGLEIDVPDFGFDPVTLNGLDQTSTRDLAVPIADLTNLGLGWKVQIGTERFTAADGAQLPAAAARVSGVAASAVDGTCSLPDNGITGYPLALPQNPSKVTVFNAAAGTGLGPASLTVGVELDVPASAERGTYTSTWTVDLAAAP